ncbi:MAG TPA: Ig-like domain-containing protein [Vicinamibacterales bacterium]|nr:Ig-like domain-containing protein [Vicinamibacterales bacterium]
MRATLLIVAAVLVAGLVACGDDQPQSPVVPSFFGPPKSLQINGDLSFTAIGQTRQLTASATFANGTVRNVSSQAEWSSSNLAIATVSGGLVRIVGIGETQITATYRNVSSSAAGVTVKPNPVLTSIMITGPAEIAPGSTAQFTATGRYADGSTSDITASASWSTFSSNLRHVGGGRFEGLTVGDAFIGVNMSGRSASRSVIILPAGTFKLSGVVRDASGGLTSVVVEVVSGTGAGQSTKSFQGGSYALFGVAGQVQLRASAPGYTTQEFTLNVTGHAVRDVTLVTTGNTTDMSGQWTLTVSTSGTCSETWSSEARTRQVGAVVTQQGTRLTIRFQNVASFIFETIGRVAANAFSMTLFYDDYYLDWGLTQRVSPTEWIGVNGEFNGTVTGAVVEGTLSGFFHYYLTNANAQGPGANPRRCPADPKFEFRR